MPQEARDPFFPDHSRMIPHGRISDTPNAYDDDALDDLLAKIPRPIQSPDLPTYDALSAPEPTRSPVITGQSVHEGVNPGDHPALFGLAFNTARRQGKRTFTWKGRQFTTDLAEEKPAAPEPAPGFNLDSVLRTNGLQAAQQELTARPSILQELDRMRARRTGATGVWNAPQAPAANTGGASGTWTPNQPENGSIKTLRAIGQVYPVAETAANLISQGVAMPVAGIAGIGALAGQALGADVDPAQTVHDVSGALTYAPRTELGQHLTEAAMYPFQKLHEGATAAGDATLRATGSPGAATAVHTAIEGVLPMAIAPAAKAMRREPAAPMPKHDLDMRLDATISALDRQNTGSIAGKPLRHLSDGLLDGLAENGALSDKARAKVQAEQARRDALTEALGRAAETPAARRGPQLLEPEATTAAAVPEATTIRPRRSLDSVREQVGDLRVVLLERADYGEVAGKKLRDMDAGMLDKLVRSPEVSEHTRDRVLSEQARRTAAKEQPHAIPPSHDVQTVVAHAPEMLRPDKPEFSSVRSTGDNGQSPLAPVRELPGGRGAAPEAGDVAGALGRDAEFRPEQFRLDDTARAGTSPQLYRSRELDSLDPGSKDSEHKIFDGARPLEAQRAASRESASVLDAQRPDFAPERVGEADRGIDPFTESATAAGDTARAGAAEGRPEGLIVLDRDTHEVRTEVHHQARPEAETPAPEQPVLLARKPIDQYGQQALENFLRGRSLSESARLKVESELARRETLNAAPGSAYAGFVNDANLPASKAATAADLAQPIRREHIVSDFSKAIGAHTYQGRVKGGKTLGFFRPRNEEVRVKHANDIETAGHELAHLIDFRDPAIKKAWEADPALKAELRTVSYDASKVREGFAEGMRLYLTQPEMLKARAPRAYAWLDNLAQTHQYGPAIRKAQADMTAWFAQDALNRARSKIGSQTRLSDHLDGIMDRFRQSALDDLHGVYRMERQLSGKIEPRGPYETARLTRASASIADGAIRHGYPRVKHDGSFEFAGKGLEQILQPVSKHLEDTLLFFVGESAHELMAQGREHLFTTSEIAAMRGLHTPERAKAFAGYQDWNRGILDFAEHMGVLNPQTRKAWQRTQYLPFSRVGQPGAFKGKLGDWSGIKALTGGTENIRDVLPNMIGNAVQLIDVALKNDARSRIAALAENRKGGRFMVKIPPESRPVTVDKAALIDAILKAMGLSRRDPRAAGLLTELNRLPTSFIEMMQGGHPPAGNNVVAVLRGGRKQWFEVADPLLLRSLEMIDRPYQHWLINWLGLPKRVGQASITLTLDFWVGNLARDTLMGAIMTRAGFRIGLDSLKGMRLRMTNDPIYRDYIANGGGLSSIYLDESKLRAKLERFYDRQGIDYRTVLDTPNKLLGAIETIGDAFEMSTRLGEFKRAVDNGAHPRHAAYLGREVSTDFAMRGDSKSLGVLFDVTMFLKAAVLSWDRMGRGLAHDENRGGIAIKAAALAGASVALYLQNRGDPRYDDLPDWDRDSNWHFFVGDQHFRYPKIWEMGALASGAERMVERTLEENPEGLGKDFARITAHTFGLNLLPQIIAPLAEQSANKRFFTDTPIEGEGMDDLIPALRAKHNTSATLRHLGEATIDLPEALQVNPVRAEALLRGYLNTWASYGLLLSDLALYGDELPTMRTDEMPVLKRFIGAEPAKHTRYEAEYYDLLGESIRMQRTFNHMLKSGDVDRAIDFSDKRDGTQGEVLKAFGKPIKELKQVVEITRRDTGLTPDQRREQIDAYVSDIHALMKDAVKTAKATSGKGIPTEDDPAETISDLENQVNNLRNELEMQQ
jgi:hypothetical protein